jgi:hypothetical protein
MRAAARPGTIEIRRAQAPAPPPPQSLRQWHRDGADIIGGEPERRSEAWR